MKNAAIISSVLLTLSVLHAGEFRSFSETNQRFDKRFHNVSEVFLGPEIHAIADENRVLLRKVTGLRPVGQAHPFYKLYVVSDQAVELKRELYSRFLSEEDLGAQDLGMVMVNAIVEVHSKNKRFLIELEIPTKVGTAGKINGSWRISPSLTTKLREVLLQPSGS